MVYRDPASHPAFTTSKRLQNRPQNATAPRNAPANPPAPKTPVRHQLPARPHTPAMATLRPASPNAADLDDDEEKRAEIPMLAIPQELYDALLKKAKLYDTFHTNVYVCLPPPEPAHNPQAAIARRQIVLSYDLPEAQTLLLTQLPEALRYSDLMHSLAGVGGLRFLRVIPGVSLSSPCAAVVVFNRADVAKLYMEYVQRFGFFGSQMTSNVSGAGERGTTVISAMGTANRFIVKKHFPNVQVHVLTRELAAELGLVFNDTDFTNLDIAFKNGATRVLRLKNTTVQAVERELGEFWPMVKGCFGPAIVVEFIGILARDRFRGTARGGSKATVVTVRFAGLRDACAAMAYFKSETAWRGRVEYGRDPASRTPVSLGWETLDRVPTEDDEEKAEPVALAKAEPVAFEPVALAKAELVAEEPEFTDDPEQVVVFTYQKRYADEWEPPLKACSDDSKSDESKGVKLDVAEVAEEVVMASETPAALDDVPTVEAAMESTPVVEDKDDFAGEVAEVEVVKDAETSVSVKEHEDGTITKDETEAEVTESESAATKDAESCSASGSESASEDEESASGFESADSEDAESCSEAGTDTTKENLDEVVDGSEEVNTKESAVVPEDPAKEDSESGDKTASSAIEEVKEPTIASEVEATAKENLDVVVDDSEDTTKDSPAVPEDAAKEDPECVGIEEIVESGPETKEVQDEKCEVVEMAVEMAVEKATEFEITIEEMD
ncbi:hypothetical protein EDC01DRAFT_782804 [Geopyxis carbonaria]|nr:hypothetical protein EDC01DRAFT_782804 [Geopyxis carbonaria]